MNLTRVQKAKLVVKIDALKKERDDLQNQLSEKRKYHASIASSELCAGDMLDQEAELDEAITTKEQLIILLSSCLAGKIKLSDEAKIKERIRTIDRNITILATDKEFRTAELEQIRKVLDIL